MNTIAITPKSGDKCVVKVFIWSEVHLSEMTYHKIHTLIYLLYFFKVCIDEAEIEKLEDALYEAARKNSFSKAKEIQSKIDKIKEAKRSTNRDSLQGEKINLIKCHNTLLPCVFIR